jgi:UDP:flavonoid glycosyltransferase YjiC (YdhE family)
LKFVLANWGTRGEVEPFAAIGRELVRRGHDVSMVVAPEMVGFAESAGPEAIPYGPTLQAMDGPHHGFFALLFSKPWKLKELNRLSGGVADLVNQYRGDVRKALLSQADGADLLLTGMNFEEVAANVAEHCGIPLATLQIIPLRVNGSFVPFLPPPLARAAMKAMDWVTWRAKKVDEDAERAEFGLPKATAPWTQRMTERGAMEIQAYDVAYWPRVADEWATWNAHKPPLRPFVGSLTMQLSAAQDDEIGSWIAAGTPPIFFSFGSMPVDSAGAGDMIDMIAGACAQLGERALVGAGRTDVSGVRHYDHVKIAGAMSYADILPTCRAVVHHGGSGTTHAGLRAGRPTLVLWMLPDQGCGGAQLKKLKVGAARRYVATTEKTLVKDLRTILDPEYLTRAQQLADRMVKSDESVAMAANLVEEFARSRRA